MSKFNIGDIVYLQYDNKYFTKFKPVIIYSVEKKEGRKTMYTCVNLILEHTKLTGELYCNLGDNLLSIDEERLFPINTVNNSRLNMLRVYNDHD